MKALVFHGPRDIRYEDHPDPSLTIDNAAIVAVEACSICGSDLHLYHGDRIGRTDYSSGVDPFCVGHEFIGSIVETGPEVHRFGVGDRVIVAGGTGCGTCDICRSRVGTCPRANACGLSTGLQGGQAEYVQVPNADLSMTKIPDGLGDEQALLLTDALATAHFGVSRCDIAPGAVVAVVGLGPIGLCGVELAFLQGASTVFAIDPVAGRRAHAESLGAIALDPADSPLDAIRAHTSGGMCDSAFEASGAAGAVELVPRILRHGGTASFIGLPQGTTLPMNQLMYRNLTVRAGIASITPTWPVLLPLLTAGRLGATGLFSHHLPLSEGAEGYRIFDAREDDVVKILFRV